MLGFERSVEVEYQVPTSSRCDQDDEGVIVVDSEEDDERCSGTMYRVMKATVFVLTSWRHCRVFKVLNYGY